MTTPSLLGHGITMSDSGRGGKPPEPGDGIRGSRTTGVFRAVNFELFAKPVRTLKSHILHFYFLDFLEEVCNANRFCLHHILHGLSLLFES